MNQKKIQKSFKNSPKTIKNFLTVEVLFDVNNHEGKEEEIIDDESGFEIKMKPIKNNYSNYKKTNSKNKFISN